MNVAEKSIAEVKLRTYQQRAIDMSLDWFKKTKDGHPCLVMPTGSGKSHIVAGLCKKLLTEWPEMNYQILMLTHVKELIEQNAEKMLLHWPHAPLGIYSAGIGKRQLGEQITFAGIQSVRNRAAEIGHIDLVIIDEAHLVNHKQEGGYRKLLDGLQAINPKIRILGLTATPYRLGHGYIHDGDALFDELLEPVFVEELVANGWLAPLRSKLTEHHIKADGVKKRGGEYIDKDLQAVVNTNLNNRKTVQETIKLAGDRKAWLFFCTGVDHAYAVRDELLANGIAAETITGDTPKAERENLIAKYKSGQIRALTNANVLTTGFDYPDIDLIVMMRPTMSPGLYVQMAGRGMRLKSHTDHCLVLDFAGVIQQHGPITAVTPPDKKGDGNGDAPVKVCEHCNELVHPSAKECPACGAAFPPPPEKTYKLSDVDIMGGKDAKAMMIYGWRWQLAISKGSGKEMLKVRYFGRALDDPIVAEYFVIHHEGYAGEKARGALARLAKSAGADVTGITDIDCIAKLMEDCKPPESILYRKDGKYFRVIYRDWEK